MTAKRDLKRRVRQRQARTGEAYVTARRHVIAASADGDPDADPETDAGIGDAETADATTTSAEAGALRRVADPDPADAVASPGLAGTVPAGAAAGAPGAVDAELDTADTGPVRAAASAAAAPGDQAAIGTIAAPVPGPPAGAARSVAELGDEAAARPVAPAPGTPAGAAMSVVELLDITDQARRVGLVCHIAMFPSLAARVEPASVLVRLRDLLVETAGDPQFRLLSQVALAGTMPALPPRVVMPSVQTVQRFFQRARAGIGGVSEDGFTLAFHVAGRDGLVPVGCAVHWPRPSLVLSGIDDLMSDVAGLRDWLTTEGRSGTGRQVAQLLAMHALPGAVRAAPSPFAPTLFVVHDGRRYAITQDEFLIGRSRGTVHLAIQDGLVSRHHAAVIRRNGAHYLKDLGSAHGITYKGMRIDNKRIDEGDVFQLGDHELRFTFQDEK
ncbi:MAG TPA: FHA domain-containing protein [Kofleriaceae bacterium]|jgi:hypothetical protein|nr:FHA domain-containing protein [Kofleriaceae bacterium]